MKNKRKRKLKAKKEKRKKKKHQKAVSQKFATLKNGKVSKLSSRKPLVRSRNNPRLSRKMIWRRNRKTH